MKRLLDAALSGAAWTLERLVRIGVMVGVIWLLSLLSPELEPSPLLKDATVRDLGMALVVPAWLVIFFVYVMGDRR